jgi:hypothetical protein
LEKKIYSDEQLEKLTPIVAVKVNREPVAKNAKPFWTDLADQELHPLERREKRFLDLCNDRKTVAQLRKETGGKKDFLDFVRKMFRKRLIGFANPFSV